MSLGSHPRVLRPLRDSRTRPVVRRIQRSRDAKDEPQREAHMGPNAARSRVRRNPVRRRCSFISSRSGARSLPRSTIHRSNASKTRVSAAIARESASNGAHAPRPSRRSETSSTPESHRSNGTWKREVSGSIGNRKGKASDQASLSKKASPLGKSLRVRLGTSCPFNRRIFLSKPSEGRFEVQSNLVEGSNIRNPSFGLAAIFWHGASSSCKPRHATSYATRDAWTGTCTRRIPSRRKEPESWLCKVDMSPRSRRMRRLRFVCEGSFLITPKMQGQRHGFCRSRKVGRGVRWTNTIDASLMFEWYGHVASTRPQLTTNEGGLARQMSSTPLFQRKRQAVERTYSRHWEGILF